MLLKHGQEKPLQHGDSVYFTFQTTAIGVIGFHNQFCVKTLVSNDIDSTNDKCCRLWEMISYKDIDHQLILNQNIPNPCDRQTHISYELTTAGNISFELVNMLGEKILRKTESKTAGQHSLKLDVSNLADGIYFYTFSFKNNKTTKKLVVKH